eukprot:scaffold7843_cov229-Pinguiococcus_pyrenoidosus.AAC.1
MRSVSFSDAKGDAMGTDKEEESCEGSRRAPTLRQMAASESSWNPTELEQIRVSVYEDTEHASPTKVIRDGSLHPPAPVPPRTRLTSSSHRRLRCDGGGDLEGPGSELSWPRLEAGNDHGRLPPDGSKHPRRDPVPTPAFHHRPGGNLPR